MKPKAKYGLLLMMILLTMLGWSACVRKTTWEYAQISSDDKKGVLDVNKLNEMGAQGWELVAISSAESTIVNFNQEGAPITHEIRVYTFKRAK